MTIASVSENLVRTLAFEETERELVRTAGQCTSARLDHKVSSNCDIKEGCDTPPLKGMNASLGQSPRKRSGLNCSGSDQNRATRNVSVTHTAVGGA
jgi:hypothetical protein